MLIGFETKDDAAVYRLHDDLAAVLTVDVITPLVDDPYDFGRIAAANALSDVFAMGAKPLTALNIIAFPVSLGASVVGETVRGAADKVREAGAIIVGGHTIDDDEPKFGLSVFGQVHPDAIVSNQGAKPGDILFYTKALGTGIMASAHRSGEISDDTMRTAIESMAELNMNASVAMVEVGAHAATDVTGFGLLGHLHEMLEPSGCAATLVWENIPIFEGALAYSRMLCRPGKTFSLITWCSSFTSLGEEDPEEHDAVMGVLCDPQTSGGLLVSVDPDKAQAFEDRFGSLAGRPPARIGVVVEGQPGTIEIL